MTTMRRTVVHRLELRDDVQPDIRELILEHLKEHGKKMRDGLVLPEDRRKSTDLSAEGGANVL